MKLKLIWEHRKYPPILMTPVVEATVFNLKKVYPKTKMNFGGNYWRNGLSDYFYENDGLMETVNNVCRDAIKNDEFLYDIFKKSLKLATDLNKFSGKYRKEELKKLNNSELIKFAKEFYDKFHNFYIYGSLQATIGYTDDNLIYQRANNILNKKLKDRAKLAEYLVKLTEPDKKTKVHKYELEILALASKAKTKNYKISIDIKKNLGKDIQNIKNKYDWMMYDFTGTVYNQSRYIKDVKNKIKNDIKQERQAINDYEETRKEEIKSIASELKLNKTEKRVFKIIRDTGYYKWAREYEFQEAWYNIDFVLTEMGKRCGMNNLEIKYLLVEEWENTLKNPKEYRNTAKDRIKNCLMIIDYKKGRQILTGNEAREKYKSFKFHKDNITDKNEIKGMSAFIGRAKGKVKIIDKKSEISKMNKGEILISKATTPEILPAMKKAAAIVTNEGGITCHAAIVSRELKIPCIVGTKIATKFLKDGDMVEVNANKGIVRKLSK